MGGLLIISWTSPELMDTPNDLSESENRLLPIDSTLSVFANMRNPEGFYVFPLQSFSAAHILSLLRTQVFYATQFM